MIEVFQIDGIMQSERERLKAERELTPRGPRLSGAKRTRHRYQLTYSYVTCKWLSEHGGAVVWQMKLRSRIYGTKRMHPSQAFVGGTVIRFDDGNETMNYCCLR